MNFLPFVFMYNACNTPFLQELRVRERMRGEVVLHLLHLRNVSVLFSLESQQVQVYKPLPESNEKHEIDFPGYSL